MSNSPGRSHRTPAKHDWMRSFVGREVGVTNSLAYVRANRWYDLTAGDGVAEDGKDWRRDSSPGILATHGRDLLKPLKIVLYEIQSATYARLLESLGENLPGLGYKRVGDDSWSYGSTVDLMALNDSGANAPWEHGRNVAVLAMNDPNAITDYVLTEEFLQGMRRRGSFCRLLSTLGCNVGGLLRLPRELREPWYQLIEKQVETLPPRHDLLLASLDGDSSRWGYLLRSPSRWRERDAADLRRAFTREGWTSSTVFYRQDRERFVATLDKLFLTEAERGEKAYV